jgi:23S rRNA pseudouridine1911/1915/1917 synthase
MADEPRRFTVEPAAAGATLAAALRTADPALSWSGARALCRAGRVTVDGAVVEDPARRLAAGAAIEIAPAAARREPADAIVHLDADLVVVRKPAGLLTVPFAGSDRDTLLSRTRVAVLRREAAPVRKARREAARVRTPRPTLRAVQRLDRDASGLVVFARSVAAQRTLQQQFAEHAVERVYLALVEGEAADAVHDTLLVRDRGDGRRGSWGRFRRAAGQPPAEARRAVTRVAVVERLPGATLVRCSLATGRQHQIRIHLAEAGTPILGETIYARPPAAGGVAAARLMLHAAVLGFVHPRSGRGLRFEDPPPPDFQSVVDGLRGRRG